MGQTDCAKWSEFIREERIEPNKKKGKYSRGMI